MTDTANNQSVPRKLDDEELDEVTGGYGQWDVEAEAMELSHYNSAHDPKYATFDEWVAGYWGQDHAAARQAWLDAGKPQYTRYVCSDNGAIRSERLIPVPVRPVGPRRG